MKNKRLRNSSTNQPVTLTITSLSHDGRGIATYVDGKTTFVTGGLPDETAICKMTKIHSRYNEAEVIELNNPSNDRVTPECKHFGICGGCSMQHMASSLQLQLKQNVLLEQLKHFGNVQPETILPPLTGNPWGYRRKARLGVRYVIKKEKALVGFREKSSSYLAELDACTVLHPSIGPHLSNLGKLIESLIEREHIPQIEVAVGDDATALVFRHLVNLPELDIEKLIEFAKTYRFHLYLQPNSPAKTHKIWPMDSQERLTYYLPDYQLEMKFHPLDFTQVNGEMNPLMLKQALKLLDPKPTENILDLFCGLGNFTLPIARSAGHVVGVEGSEEMVMRAAINAEQNQLSNTEFFAANLAEIPLTRPEWMQRKYDKVLLDPPRTGAKEIIELFSAFSPKRIVYVSCNPATLARDAGELVNKLGYKLKNVGIINMFPHTNHIEAIATFDLK